MRLSSLCLSALVATTTFRGGAVVVGGRGFVAAFAASSSTRAGGGAPRCPTAIWAPGGGGGGKASSVRAFVVDGRLRAGGLGTSSTSIPSRGGGFLGGPPVLRASTQESTDLSVEEENVEAKAKASAADDDNVDDDDEELRAEILSAAHSSSSITGPHTSISSFGGLSYVDTSLLDASVPKRHRVVFVLGGPGAGKGTQSDRIVDSYKCVHLSVGELLRAERQRGDDSPHADLIEDALVNGNIVPVEISLELLRNAMDDAAVAPHASDLKKYGSRIFLVDGFPRNFDNLSGWTANMPDAASAIGVLCYDCPQDVLEQRILTRAETSGRSDDNLESARKRFRTFREQTVPVVRALEEVERAQVKDEEEESGGMSKMRVYRIAAEGTVDQVWDLTKGAMDKFVRDDVLTASERLIDAVNDMDLESYGALCDSNLLADDDEEDESSASKGGGEVADEADRMEKIFYEYEAARVDVGPDGPTDAIRTPTLTQTNVIENAEVAVQDGTHATVSYDRIMKLSVEGQEMESSVRETRVWEHQERGWACVHFYRTPLE
eukprot:CAMPEP_0113567994 /NCGR_PEP_ID=MMETSP0015_2-20120614/23591_1 /TAXON_ID=2838 /ORGANISM="Odontella" /LENGTH=549 /DNA_ID=CAMNT_0000470463 /DNA_START=37 /DNA_END=1686 /DNA_ORIENTATION=- /assembly_acc=CAM_ASM_000160